MGSDSAFGEPFYSIKDSGTRHEFNTGAVRDIQLKLSDISPGDIIEHESWGCNHGGMRERLTRRKGKVIQVTDKVITLQGKNYPETLLVNDLLSGRAKILKVRGEDTMARYYWKALWPQVQELQAAGNSIREIAEELDIDLSVLRAKIYREKRIAAEKQTPTPESAAAANQEPVQESQEPAGDSVAQGAPFDEAAFNPDKPEITVKDVLQYELAQREQGFGPEDEEPIPYQVVGKYEALGKAIGALVDEKNLQYGDAFNRGGCILEILYPDGVRPDQYRDMLGVIRVIDKLFRVANGKQGREDPWQDIAGYGLLGTGE